jgi:hypothetical protein
MWGWGGAEINLALFQTYELKIKFCPLGQCERDLKEVRQLGFHLCIEIRVTIWFV